MSTAEKKRGIDHLVLCVADLEAAGERYRRLGFTVTPPARHPFGTGNRLIQLQHCFLELLTVVDRDAIPAPEEGQFGFAAFNQDFLTRREGASMLVFESADARADQREFAAAGLQTYDPFDFRRQARLPDGTEVTVGFSLAFVTEPRMPEVAFFCCQQHAPEHFWKPEYQDHANGARTLSQVVLVAEEPAALAGFFAKLQSREVVTPSDSGNRLTVTTARGQIAVLTPERFAGRFPGMKDARAPDSPYLAGCQLEVRDLDAARRVLEGNRVPFRVGSDPVGAPTLQIGPEFGMGCVIELVQEAR